MLIKPNIIKATNPKKSQPHAVVAFLLGEGRISDDFSVSKEKDTDDHHVTLELKPKKDADQIKWLNISVNKDKNEIETMSFEDAVGNVTELNFKDIKFNTELDAKLFKFAPPKGADVTVLRWDVPSFDIVSEVNFQEVDNAVNQVKKEISTRYDFRGAKSEIQFENNEIKIIADDETKLRALKDILESKLTKRGINLKAVDYQKIEEGSMNTLRQVAKLINGLTKEKAKEITAVIKDTRLKVQPSIVDDQVRVAAKSIDDLQQVIQALKSKDVGVPLQFKNMRS